MTTSCSRPRPASSPAPRPGGSRRGGGARLLAALLLSAPLVLAPAAAPAAVLPEAEPLLARLEAAIDPLRDLEASFLQVRHLSLTDETVEAGGRLRFLAPGSFRLDYKAPDADVLTMSDDSLLVYFPSMAQAHRHRIDREDATRNLFLLFASKKGELARRFDISLAPPSPGGAGLRFQPLPGAIDYPISEIVVRPHRKTGLPEELFFREEGGDTILFRLSDLKTNRRLTPADFVFVPPAGTEIIDR